MNPGIERVILNICHTYSVSSPRLCWSMRFFFGKLHQTNINAMVLVLYNLKKENPRMKCHIFLRELALPMIKPHTFERLQTTMLQRSLCIIICDCPCNIGLPRTIDEQLRTPDELKRKQRCIFCTRWKLVHKTGRPSGSADGLCITLTILCYASIMPNRIIIESFFSVSSCYSK